MELALESHAPCQGYNPRLVSTFARLELNVCLALLWFPNWNVYRLRRWPKLIAIAWLTQSVFYCRRVQHFNRRLRRSSKRALSQPNWMVAEICQSLHCATCQIYLTSSTWRSSRLHAFYRLLSRSSHEWAGCKLLKAVRGKDRKNHRSWPNNLCLRWFKQLTRLGSIWCTFCWHLAFISWHFGPMAQRRSRRFLYQRWNQSTWMWKFNYFPNTRMWSYKSKLVYTKWTLKIYNLAFIIRRSRHISSNQFCHKEVFGLGPAPTCSHIY